MQANYNVEKIFEVIHIHLFANNFIYSKIFSMKGKIHRGNYTKRSLAVSLTALYPIPMYPIKSFLLVSGLSFIIFCKNKKCI